MKTNYKIISTIVAVMLFLGCSKDFLDITPIGKQTTETFFASYPNIKSAMAAAYEPIQQNIMDDYKQALSSEISDEAETGGQGDWPEGNDYDRINITPTMSKLDEIYGVMYEGIVRCNVIIEKLPVLAKNNPEIKTSEINRYRGEARFMRAMYYFVLTRVFGGVQLVDKVLTSDQYVMPRSDIKKMYELMESDFKYASVTLPLEGEWPGGQADVGRATKGAAQGMLSKLLLYESSYALNYPGDARFGAVEQRWSEALAYADSVIISGKYYLVGIDGEKYSTFWTNGDKATNGFRYIFSVPGNNCPESIFSIQHSNTQTYGGTRSNKTTAVRRYFAYDAKGVLQSYDDHGWGYDIPTHFLLSKYDSSDVRIKTTFGQKGDSIYVKSNIVKINKVPVTAWFKIDPATRSTTKMSCFKYEVSPVEYNQDNGWTNGPQNMILLRMGELYLIAAEAAMHAGKSGAYGDALYYLNMVRKRARMCGDGVIPADLSAIDQDAIMDERLRELALEGERFFDLVRCKMANRFLNHYLETLPPTPVVFEEGKNDFFPLPLTQVQSSKGALTQYEGW